jgi:hypothetical protein
LFAEKSEVTVTHQSTEDLRNKLRGKLEKLVQPVEIEEVDYEDVVLDGEALNLEEELGVDEIADAVNEVADDSIHS